MKRVQAQLAPKLENDEPTSPRTQRALQHQTDIFVLAEARFPRKGKVNLHQQDTLVELLGARDALQLIKKQKVKESQSLVDVLNNIYLMMSEILNDVRQMVCSLPSREVKQSVLDKEVHKLATASLPDPSQQSMLNHYLRTASGLLGHILKNNDKIIVEMSRRPLSIVVRADFQFLPHQAPLR
ncbi:uncharacterized protein LOC141668485 [Apium graveolens]|uniref:uncharacterized protein LOC141668485 n=1 Tax=Apium graveolens TaxID=4045 RepID=UPI003D793F6D